MINEIDFGIPESDRLKKTISSLSLKLKEAEDAKLLIKEKAERDIARLELKLTSANRNSYIVSATEKHKQIIKLFAFGFSIGATYKICTEEMGLDVTIDEVESITNSIDFAHEELQRYYVEMKELFQAKNSLDKGFFSSSLYKKLQLLENEISLSMVKAKEVGDEGLKLKCTENLLKIYERMATMFSKNGLDIFSKQLSVKLLDDYDKQNDKVFKKGEVVEIDINDININ